MSLTVYDRSQTLLTPLLHHDSMRKVDCVPYLGGRDTKEIWVGGLQRQIPLFPPKDIESESGCFSSKEEGSFSAPQYEILQRLVIGLGSKKERYKRANTISLLVESGERK